jgi:hypothetical protein
VLFRSQTADNAFQHGAFLTEILGALRVIPDFGVFQFAADFF